VTQYMMPYMLSIRWSRFFTQPR